MNEVGFKVTMREDFPTFDTGENTTKKNTKYCCKYLH